MHQFPFGTHFPPFSPSTTRKRGKTLRHPINGLQWVFAVQTRVRRNASGEYGWSFSVFRKSFFFLFFLLRIVLLCNQEKRTSSLLLNGEAEKQAVPKKRAVRNGSLAIRLVSMMNLYSDDRGPWSLFVEVLGPTSHESSSVACSPGAKYEDAVIWTGCDS